MFRVLTLVAVGLLIASANVASAEPTSTPPGHKAKGTHGMPGASYNAPGQVKKRMHLKSARL
jgi:hypothetical protein